MIPKIFHTIWFGKKPYKYPQYLESFKSFHPEWEFHIWTEDNLPEKMMEKKIIEFFKDQSVSPNYRSDVARFVLLKLFGGVYADHDMECFKKFDEFLMHDSFCGSRLKNKEGKKQPFSALFGTIPNGDWITKAEKMTLNILNDVDYNKLCYYHKNIPYPIPTAEQMSLCDTVYPEYYFYKDLFGFNIKYSRHRWANDKEDGWLTELRKKQPVT